MLVQRALFPFKLLPTIILHLTDIINPLQEGNLFLPVQLPRLNDFASFNRYFNGNVVVFLFLHKCTYKIYMFFSGVAEGKNVKSFPQHRQLISAYRDFFINLAIYVVCKFNAH